MKLILALGGLTAEEKSELESVQTKFQEKLLQPDCDKETIESIYRRRELLDRNVEMGRVFRMIWMLVSMYQDPDTNALTEEGYVKFNILVQGALIGPELNPQEALDFAKAEYLSDTACYGPLNEIAFYDLLAELVEIWAENSQPAYFAAFSWALLISIADLTTFPPRFRPVKNIKCFTSIGESELLQNFATDHETVKRMEEWTTWSRTKHIKPQAKRRLVARRNAVNLNQPTADVVLIMSTYAKNKVSKESVWGPDDYSIYDETSSTSPRSEDTTLPPIISSAAAVNKAAERMRQSMRMKGGLFTDNLKHRTEGKAAFSFTIASKLMRKASDARRQSVLNAKSIQVIPWLKSISHLVGIHRPKSAIPVEKSITESDGEHEDDQFPVPNCEVKLSRREINAHPGVPFRKMTVNLVQQDENNSIDFFARPKYTSLVDMVRKQSETSFVLSTDARSLGLCSVPDDSCSDTSDTARPNTTNPENSTRRTKCSVRPLTGCRTGKPPRLITDSNKEWKYKLDLRSSGQHRMPHFRVMENPYHGVRSRIRSDDSHSRRDGFGDYGLLSSNSSEFLVNANKGDSRSLTRQRTDEMLMSEYRKNLMSCSSTGSAALLSVGHENVSYGEDSNSAFSSLHEGFRSGKNMAVDLSQELSQDLSTHSWVSSTSLRPSTTGSIAIDRHYRNKSLEEFVNQRVSEGVILSVKPAPVHLRDSVTDNRRKLTYAHPTSHNEITTGSSIHLNSSQSAANSIQNSAQSELLLTSRPQSAPEKGCFGYDSTSVNQCHDNSVEGSRNSTAIPSEQSIAATDTLLTDDDFGSSIVNDYGSSMASPSVLPGGSLDRYPRYMQGTRHLKKSAIDGLKRSTKLVTYFTDSE
eukprot:CAMPEP_0185039108 /NCGR_PEP_ID=MMETSP1103-20130426/35614_1 /TAXON_ID=36769 /ORGANISM="Paraphysomonas bandaiensis, Strain Caron Lab Isolate" /LENGTH=865 /DNA_ID=CAMNT_0027577873 /DNA_START=98 /DNA_END=2695 /DNA_ORIENTATION=-